MAGIITPDAPNAKLVFAGHPISAVDQTRAIPLNGDTPFEIGSVTKTFTSTVFLRRHHTYDGVLGDFITNGLVPAGVASIPIMDLERYSPGLPSDNEGAWWAGILNADALAPLIGTLKKNQWLPQCPPGQHFAYSKLAWGLLGLAAVGVDSVLDHPLERWNHEIGELTRYLGMSTRTRPIFPDVRSILPAAYSLHELLPPTETYNRAAFNTIFGSGDLVSTGDDMYRWLESNMGRLRADLRFLRKQQLPIFTWHTRQPKPADSSVKTCYANATPVPFATDMAWFRHTPINTDVTYLWKDGEVTGFSSWMGFKSWAESGKPSDIGTFVLVNQPGCADPLGITIMNKLLHVDGAEPPPTLGDAFLDIP